MPVLTRKALGERAPGWQPDENECCQRINFSISREYDRPTKERLMLNKGMMNKFAMIGVTAAVLVLLSQSAFAAIPVVKTVPWVASNPLISHDTWSGKSTRLKGTSDQQGANFQWTWDFGDGTPVATGTVTNMYVVEASHVYTGAVNTTYSATLTIQDTSIPAPNTGTATYYVTIRSKSLPVEVNVAIDEGLWFLHKDMTRTSNYGYWAHYYNTETAANLNAFFVNGHLETGAASNPYTDTVQRGMRRLFTLLTPVAIGNQNYAAPIGTVNPDSNGNGFGIHGYDTEGYSTGIFLDAIVASGTPNAITTTGVANVTGRTYKDIVQDIADWIAWAQTDAGTSTTWSGGWGYGANYGSSDNSVNQWCIIGLFGAKDWGVTVPSFVSQANLNSLANTHSENAAHTEMWFNYTNNGSSGWGVQGTTPAGMVQMVFDGIGRGNTMWDETENYVRNNFCNTGGYTGAMRSYYYGLFSFTKSMLLTPPAGIQLLTNRYPVAGANPIDWYSAEASAGAQCDGVARTLVNDQNAGGNWSCHGGCGYHDYFETAWAVIMLNRTVFASGLPVAVAKAFPNPAVAGQTINLNGASSFSQDPARKIVAWAWDLNNDGTFETPGVTASISFPAVGTYTVNLQVTDDATPPKTATTVLQLLVSLPPVAPSANAGGPYNFCVGQNWFLDGSGSINPDNGLHEPGAPGDFIKSYAWDLLGHNTFTDATGVNPNVTNFWTPGSYVIQLKVTDNTALSFPSSQMGNLSSVASGQVIVRGGNRPGVPVRHQPGGTPETRQGRSDLDLESRCQPLQRLPRNG